MAVLTSVVILRPSNVIRLAGGKDFNEKSGGIKQLRFQKLKLVFYKSKITKKFSKKKGMWLKILKIRLH